MARGKGESKTNTSNNALVVGGGVSGIRAALDLAEAGHQVTLVEEKPNLGGILMQLDRQFPTNDCGICKMLPTIMRENISECCLRRDLTHPNITVLTNSTIKKASGEAGKFTIDVTQKPKFIDPLKCISCGKCEEVCPVEVPNEFNDSLDSRKAIFTPYPLPNPNTYTLDMENCTQCGECVNICPTDAVNLKAKEKQLIISAGAVILAPGLQIFDPKPFKEYAYGINPNILTSIDFERIYSGLGPYSGKRTIVRPSDQKVPKNLGFIQCVGSRNTQIGHEYCSYACCMYSLKEAMLAKEANPKMNVTIFFMDMRAFGKNYHEYYLKAKDLGINFVRCRVPEVQTMNDSDNLMLTLVQENGKLQRQEFDMVVLSVGLESPKNAKNLADIFGIKLDKDDFSVNNDFSPLSTSKPGIFVCGGFTGPKDIPESVTEASAAAGLVGTHLGKPKEEKLATKEIESSSNIEEPAIGVILCSCGKELEPNLDIKELEEFSKSLSGVKLVKKYDYLCINPDEIKNELEASETKINRLMIAACTPYHLEIKFKAQAQAAGMDVNNIELINLRERIAWNCDKEQDRTLATTLAKSQIAIIHERLTSIDRLSPKDHSSPVNRRALVVGGGITGMTSAVVLADNGVPVDLIEKSDTLGGNLKDIFSTLDHEDTQELLKNFKNRIKNEKNITVHW
jgi:heterodisulfide reductase subunit A